MSAVKIHNCSNVINDLIEQLGLCMYSSGHVYSSYCWVLHMLDGTLYFCYMKTVTLYIIALNKHIFANILNGPLIYIRS